MSDHTNDPWIKGQRVTLARVLTQTGADKCEHAGLWFDKYLDRQQKKGIPLGKDDTSPYKTLIDSVATIAEPTMYQHFFARWQQQAQTMRVAIDGCEYKVECRYATAQGRIALGLGDESVIETAVTLHHTYGVPYIPGSALKGLAAAYAHRVLEDERWRKPEYRDGRLVQKGGDYHRELFGTTASAGYVTFFDALYVPGSGYKDNDGIPRALWPDVITVHHKDYYSGTNPKPPADWDSPTPIPFLTATGTYLILLGGPLAWVTFTFDLLEKALAEMGIGAKTSSGYGRMTITKERPAAQHPPDEQTTSAAQTTTDVEQQYERAVGPSAAPTLPTIGDTFTSKITAVDESVVIVIVPGFSNDKAVGVLKAEAIADGRTDRYRVGNRARVEVVVLRTLKNGRTILELKPGVRKEEK